MPEENENPTTLSTDRGISTARPVSSQSVGAILAQRHQPRSQASAHHEGTLSKALGTRSLKYSFVPFPVELAELERRALLPPAQIKLLMLRRFANPISGVWITSTRDVALLIGVDRSTAQKSLRILEQAQFLHMQHLRGPTVQLVLSFGGFSEPIHRRQGKMPLHWDAEFTGSAPVPAHSSSQYATSWHTGSERNSGLMKPGSAVFPNPSGTALRDIDQENKDKIRSKENFSTEKPETNPLLVPVETFQPQSHDESVVHELACKLGEKYLNSFLSMRRLYGLARLEKACALAQDKLHDIRFPFLPAGHRLRQWLLKNLPSVGTNQVFDKMRAFDAWAEPERRS